MNTGMHHAALVAAIVACTIAALVDLRTGQIPNWLTLGLFGGAPLVRAVATLYHHHPLSSAVLAAILSLASGVGSALIPLALARSGGLGLGDVKLFAAIGAACGVFVALYAQTYAYVFAMAYAFVVVARKRRLRSTIDNIKELVGAYRTGPVRDPASKHEAFTEVKFAPAILCGMCVAAWAQWKW